MLKRAENYEELYRSFRWNVPRKYNMAHDVCDRHAAADPDKLALITIGGKDGERRYSFSEIQRLSNKFANLLAAQGIMRGDRVAILLPQCPETAIAHVAAYKLGAIALPLFVLFGEDALEYRLANAGAKVLLTDTINLPKILAIRERLPALKRIIVIDGGGGDLDLWPQMGKSSEAFETVDTNAEDPALLVYTSGTTGPPKGALHAHRTMFGHMPGFDFYHEFPPQKGDLGWTPADWAWIGGLMDLLMPCWFHGIPVLAHRAGKFDPEEAYALMTKYQVRNTFIPPTALKMMRQVGDAKKRYSPKLRSLFTGGETLGEEVLAWGRETFDITFNEGYGQTEFNICVGNCSAIMPVKPGSMGRAVPGHSIEIVDDEGNLLPVGKTGNIAFKTPDPVAMIEYWCNPEATREKYRGPWMLSGDEGMKDEDGYFWFQGRADDVITSAGYRIGPGEIEDCLMKHPAVGLAAAIGVPDPVRTELIKAVIVLNPGFDPGSGLETEIREFVKVRLAAHEYPRLIEFVDSMPLTATGKIRRKDLREREIARGDDSTGDE
ncbi:MAG: acyl-CoA synthetase [Alphaproteobacteria bacterium]|nr:acyl-CoA synthetase [Alphaproteobacteria bacterium]